MAAPLGVLNGSFKMNSATVWAVRRYWSDDTVRPALGYPEPDQTHHHNQMQIPSSELIRHTDTHFASQIGVAQEVGAIQNLRKVVVVTEVAGGTQ